MWISSLGRRGRLCLLATSLLALAAIVVVLQGGYYRATYHLHAAREALDHHDYIEAEVHLKRCLQFCPDSAEGHFLLARLTRRAGRVNEAAEHLETSRSLGWSNDAIHLESVLAQIQQGQFLGTVEYYLSRRLDNHDSESFLIYEALSQGYTKTFQLSKALGCLNKMLEQQPDNVYALVRRGWILERFNRFDEAEIDYRRAVALQPEHALAQQRLAENLLVHAKKAAEAAEHFEALARLQPDDVTAEVNLAKCWREMGRLDETRTLLDRLLAAHPRVAAVLLERGQLALNEGRHEQAENWLRRSLELQPHSAQGNYTLYLCLTRQGKVVEADRYLACFKAAEADDKHMEQLMKRVNEAPNPALRCEAALLFFRTGEDQEGERWLLMALQADPTYRPAHEALAAYYERTGRAEQAESHRRLTQPSDATDPASVSLTRP